MSLPFTSITKNGDGTWTFAWASTGAPSYRVVLWGRQIDSRASAIYTFSDPSYRDSPPPLEVVSLGDVAVSESGLPYFVAQWYGTPGVDHYDVQRLISAVWTLQATLMHTGEWVHTYQSRMLPDDATYEFRVLAVDRSGNSSPAASYKQLIVRPPDPTIGLTYAYASGNLTIDGA